MIVELDAADCAATSLEKARVLTTYVWGPDLAGQQGSVFEPESFSGAGGVGGLLAIRHQTNTYYPCMDANGNIMGLVNATAGTLTSRYDYDPFGARVTDTGPTGGNGQRIELCPFGFSTKYTDSETGLAYYGYRVYDPPNGRWLNRDPIGEQGGINLYEMVGNDIVNGWDYLGLLEVLVVTSKDVGAAVDWLAWHAATAAKALGENDHHEYGGTICVACCGDDRRKVFATGPTRGGPNSYNVLASKDPRGNFTDICPPGTLAAAGYHSHPPGGGGPSGWSPDPNDWTDDWGRFNPSRDQARAALRQMQANMNPNDNLGNPGQMPGGGEDPEYVGHRNGVSKVPNSDPNRAPISKPPPKPPLSSCTR
jgi:RHS repeat-associated protein